MSGHTPSCRRSYLGCVDVAELDHRSDCHWVACFEWMCTSWCIYVFLRRAQASRGCILYIVGASCQCVLGTDGSYSSVACHTNRGLHMLTRPCWLCTSTTSIEQKILQKTIWSSMANSRMQILRMNAESSLTLVACRCTEIDRLASTSVRETATEKCSVPHLMCADIV